MLECLKLKYFEELGKSFQLDEGKFDYTEYENKVEIEKFWEVFGKQWLAYGYDEEYHHLQSKQSLYFTQTFLEYLCVLNLSY